MRLKAVGGSIEQLGHAALVEMLAVIAAIAVMRLTLHIIVAADHAFKVAVDDRVSIVAEHVVRHQRDFAATTGRIHHKLGNGQSRSVAAQELDDLDSLADGSPEVLGTHDLIT